MNKNSKITGLYFALLVLFLTATVTLRTVACLFDLEYTYGMFRSYTMLNIAGAICGLGAVLLFTYAFFAAKISATPNFSAPSTYMPTGLVAIGLIFLSISMLKEKAPFGRAPLGLIVLCSVLAIASAIHFFLNAFFTEAHTEFRAYFSLATVLFLALYASYLYFDSTLSVNAPNKLTDQLSFLFSALFFLYEARISLGRERWRPYAAFGFIAALLTAYSSIPSLIVYFARGKVISNSIEETILSLTLFIFISARLFMVAALKESSESRAITGMQSFARRREEIIAESINVHKEAFAVQMTIDDILPEVKKEEDIVVFDVLEMPDPEIVEEAPQQITLEMLLPEIDENDSGSER